MASCFLFKKTKNNQNFQIYIPKTSQHNIANMGMKDFGFNGIRFF